MDELTIALWIDIVIWMVAAFIWGMNTGVWLYERR